VTYDPRAGLARQLAGSPHAPRATVAQITAAKRAKLPILAAYLVRGSTARELLEDATRLRAAMNDVRTPHA
jgi:hypothetical protein